MKVCLTCTTTYAPADACPQCGATKSVEEWEMAKISRHGGASVDGEAQPVEPDKPKVGGPDPVPATERKPHRSGGEKTHEPRPGDAPAGAFGPPTVAPGKGSVPPRSGLKGKADEPVDLPVTEDLVAAVAPDGTVDQVITWTEEDTDPPARLLAALDAEKARPSTRATLVAELERRLTQF